MIPLWLHRWQRLRKALKSTLPIWIGATLLVGLLMSVYFVPEEEQVVIVRTGEPVGTVNTPGGPVFLKYSR